MGSLVRILWQAVLYACLATIVALGAIGAYLVLGVGVDSDKALRAWAAFNGVNVTEVEAKAAEEAADKEDLSHDDLLEARLVANLDRDLRQQSIRQGLSDLARIRDEVATEQRRFDERKNAFDDALQEFEMSTADEAISDIQQTLVAIKPKQAKDHIIRMLPPSFGDQPLAAMDPAQRKAVYDVVAIMRKMPIDKRKKIIEEFRSEEEAETLAEMLRLIRLGVPKVEIIKDAQARLEEFKREDQ